MEVLEASDFVDEASDDFLWVGDPVDEGLWVRGEGGSVFVVVGEDCAEGYVRGDV